MRLPSWRTLLVATGLPYVLLSIGSACLDYAGEDLEMEACPTAGDAAPDAGATDCGVKPPVTGSGSGSGSALP